MPTDQPSTTGRDDLPPGIPADGGARTLAAFGNLSSLDQCLADWGQVASTEAVHPGRWFRDDLPVGLDVAPGRPDAAEEVPDGSAGDELAALPVVVLLSSAPPVRTSAGKEHRRVRVSWQGRGA
jgi:hypothetical protein